MLSVIAETASSRPPRKAAWRAGFWPRPAARTHPMRHSSTLAGSSAARETASRTTRAPSSVAEKLESDPWNFPTGVRTADTMTISCDSSRMKTFLHRGRSIRFACGRWLLDGCVARNFCVRDVHHTQFVFAEANLDVFLLQKKVHETIDFS